MKENYSMAGVSVTENNIFFIVAAEIQPTCCPAFSTFSTSEGKFRTVNSVSGVGRKICALDCSTSGTSKFQSRFIFRFKLSLPGTGNVLCVASLYGTLMLPFRCIIAEKYSPILVTFHQLIYKAVTVTISQL